MKYGIHLVTGLGIIILILLGILLFVPAPIREPKVRDQAIEKAQKLWQQQHTAGISFENGPCLTEELLPDWAADIAHQPRQDQDNLPANQCQSYRQGKAHHFVELDLQGNLIRAL